MAEKFRVAIIGGGVVGCCVAWELSKVCEDICVFEQNPGVTCGKNQSLFNSGVIHAGIYYEKESRPLKARFCVEGNRLWYEFCGQYEVPYRKNGKLVVAVNEAESKTLDLYLERAQFNGVHGIKKISGREVKELEPNVFAHSALLVPTTGVVRPSLLIEKLHDLAREAGVRFLTDTKVSSISPNGRTTTIHLETGSSRHTMDAQLVINSAGVNAVRFARMVDPDFPLKPALVRADSLKYSRSARPEIYVRSMNIYPTPVVVETPTGKQHSVGIHLSPILDMDGVKGVVIDSIAIGPKLVAITNENDYQTPVPTPEAFLTRMDFFPALKPMDLTHYLSAIQARLNGHPDFFISQDRIHPNIIHLVGIDSPGLTAAPAIARHVTEMIVKKKI